MIKIYVKDVGSLTAREATALGLMFMNLAGHTLEAAPEKPSLVPGVPDMILASMSEPKQEYVCPPISDMPLFFTEPTEEPLIEDAASPEVSSDSDSDSQYDSDGIRWDARIHAKNKSKTAGGIWKLGRNLPPHLIKAVMKELKSSANPTSPVIAPPPVSIPIPPPLPVPPPVPVPPPAPFIPPLPVPSAPIVPPVPAPIADDAFDVLMQRVMDEVQAKRLTIPVVTQIVRNFKDANGEPIVSTLGLVGTHPELIAPIMAELDKVIK